MTSPAVPAGFFRRVSSLVAVFMRGLRPRLMTFTVLSVLLPIFVAGLIVHNTFRRTLMDLSLREQAETARRLSDRVAANVEGVRRVLSTVASTDLEAPSGPRVTPQELRQARETLTRFMRNYPAVMELALLGPDGKEKMKAVREGNKVAMSKELINRAGRDEVRRALAGRAATGPVFFTMKDRHPQLFLTTPLGKGKGILQARISLDSLSDLAAEVSDGENRQAFVVERGGRLIAHRDREVIRSHQSFSGDPVVREFAERGNEFVDGGRPIREGWRNRVTSLAAGHKVPGSPWVVVVRSPMQSALAPIYAAARRSALGVGIAGLFFLAAGLWLAYRILKPLRLLHEGARKIGQGQLSHRLDIRTGDEIQKLAEEFNAMAGALERLEETKRDLTHMIVHDLKSPLSSILGSLDYVLMASKEISVEHKKLLSLGSKAGKDLLRMIQNLLDLGKMEEGKLELKLEVFSLLDLAAQCVDDLEANMHREGKMVSVEIPKSVPKVRADRDLLHRVLSNLLSNALKHTSKGAEIAIRAEAADEGTSVVLSIRDTGEGIPPEFLGKIFEKFGQADMRREGFRVGTGLGLTFCKLAVDSHGGKIWVESEKGKGSEFFVKLPLPPPEEINDAPSFPSGKISRPGQAAL